MRVIFAGTPEFAAKALEALIQSEHEVVMVLSQPDRPAGRGRKLKESAVKALAKQHNIPVYTPLSLRVEKGGEETAEVLTKMQEAKRMFLWWLLTALSFLSLFLIFPRAFCLRSSRR